MSISSYFQQYLGRKPDEGGLKFYRDQLTAGASMADIQRTIRTSTEAKDHNRAAIQKQAQQSFGKSIDVGGQSYFNDAVSSGTGSLAQALNAIATSPQAQSYAARQQIAKQYADEKKSSDNDLSALTQSLEGITGGFQSSMQALSENLGTQQAGYQKSLQDMMNTLTASNNPNTTEKVLGVKSAGDANAMTIKKQKQGVKGTFGREGLRIKGLNI
jgi:hypothetical protein